MPIGQVIGVDFVQKVDVLHKEVEHRYDNLLATAVGCLGPLCCPLQGCTVVAEVAGGVHMMLWAQGRQSESLKQVQDAPLWSLR